jgi:hypothetical protein
MSITGFFLPDHERHEGVRPIQVWGLRVFYGLMALLVAPQAWSTLLSHPGPWEPTKAVAWCVWAAYPTLSLLGVFKPLKMLPLMVFMLFYKGLWLAFVAWPLWSAGQLAGTPTGEMARVFVGIWIPALFVPWGYAARTYLSWPRRSADAARVAGLDRADQP